MPSTIKLGAKKFLLKAVIKFLPQASDKNLLLIASLAEKLTSDQATKNAIAGLKQLVASHHPSIGLARRLFKDTNPRCREKFIDNLLINGLLLNREKIKLGSVTPMTVLISPTMRCNLNCVGCYAANYNKSDDLPFEVFDRIVGEGVAMGVSFFTILGGEPLFYQQIFDLFKKYPDVYFQCYTNGTLIDEKLANQIIEVGNVLPIISIEGYEKETDERRGVGTYQKVMTAMGLLKKKAIPFGFSVAVTRKNAELVSSDEFIDFMIDKGAFLGWFFMYMPVGSKPDLDLMPTPEQRKMLLERDNHIRATKPLFIIDFWNDAPFVGGCIAGKEYIHITSKGDVEPCIFTHFAVDNIKEKSLQEVMDSEFFRELRRRQPYNDNLLLPCMWIDNPEVSRELIVKHRAYPTHPGADDVLVKEDLKAGIDKYSSEVKELYKDIWEEFKKDKIC